MSRFTPTGVGKTHCVNALQNLFYGSPPRVWGKRPSVSVQKSNPSVHPHGCGENVGAHGLAPASRSVHPHGCGENMPPRCAREPIYGSPPRVWGKRYTTGTGRSITRFTPTGVGKTLRVHKGVYLGILQLVTPLCGCCLQSFEPFADDTSLGFFCQIVGDLDKLQSLYLDDLAAGITIEPHLETLLCVG